MRPGPFRLFAAVAIAAATLLPAPAFAAAKVVSYNGEGVNVKSGQTRGLPVYVTFKLIGNARHAKVGPFTSVDWAYPNCPEVLDGLFEIAKSHPRPVSPKNQTFDITGTSELYPATHVEISGRILPNRSAKGWFDVSEGPCSTGHIAWAATPE